jgi:hypothetical protein
VLASSVYFSPIPSVEFSTKEENLTPRRKDAKEDSTFKLQDLMNASILRAFSSCAFSLRLCALA